VENLGRGTRGNGKGTRNFVFFWGVSCGLSGSVNVQSAEKRKREDMLLTIDGKERRELVLFLKKEMRGRHIVYGLKL
jgi:hypothetical protein